MLEMIVGAWVAQAVTAAAALGVADALADGPLEVAVLAEGKIIAIAPVAELEASEHPWIKAYFHGARGRAPLETGRKR